MEKEERKRRKGLSYLLKTMNKGVQQQQKGNSVKEKCHPLSLMS